MDLVWGGDTKPSRPRACPPELAVVGGWASRGCKAQRGYRASGDNQTLTWRRRVSSDSHLTCHSWKSEYYVEFRMCLRFPEPFPVSSAHSDLKAGMMASWSQWRRGQGEVTSPSEGDSTAPDPAGPALAKALEPLGLPQQGHRLPRLRKQSQIRCRRCRERMSLSPRGSRAGGREQGTVPWGSPAGGAPQGPCGWASPRREAGAHTQGHSLAEHLGLPGLSPSRPLGRPSSPGTAGWLHLTLIHTHELL